MPFRDFAATETSTLVARLLAGRSELSLHQLKAFREAVEAAAQAVQTAIESAPANDGDVQALVERLSEASAADVQAEAHRLADEARQQIDAVRAELAARTSELAERTDALHARDEELRAKTEEGHALTATLTDLRAEIELLHAELVHQRQEADAAAQREAEAKAALEDELLETRAVLDGSLADVTRLSSLIEAARVERDDLEMQMGSFQSQVQAMQAQRDSVSTLLVASNARVQTLERERRDHDRAMRELQARLEDARDHDTAIRPDAPASKDLERAQAEVEALNEEVLQFGVRLEETLEAFQRLAAASTIGEVLAAFLQQLATGFARVALFRVKGNRLEGEHHIGFDFQSDITNVVIPLSMDSLLTRAVVSGKLETLSGPDLADTSRMPFAGTPGCALALPIVVGGETLAIVYADDSGQQQSEQSSAFEWKSQFAELLRQHSIALVMRLTNELKALAELREYAATLLSEAEHMYASDVKSGKKDAELRSRLKDNLECARRIYAQRIALEGPAAAGLLEEHIATVIEEQQATAFGRDLAAVASKGGKNAERSSSRRTAEAS
jgi:hypothetical protein